MGGEKYDLAVVGAGVVGLAHAYHAARRGWKVLVVEKGRKAQGASIRNFGMLWPIGQPAGERLELALRSRGQWLDALGAAGIWHDRCGSMHLAYHDDEAAVLEEFASAAPAAGFDCRLEGPDEISRRVRGVKTDGLRRGLWSPVEVCVDPPRVIAGLANWLEEAKGVEFEFGRTVTSVENGELRAGRTTWRADRVVIASGDDIQTLFPEDYAALGLIACKLQMMRTAPAGDGYRVGPMLAAGLTLRHYPSFAACPSLPRLRERLDLGLAEYGRLGIHVLVSQNGEGEIVLGDSHEYGEEIGPFDQARIDDLVLAYLGTFLELPAVPIARRWHGIYLKHPEKPWLIESPAEGVRLVTGVGGAGMTLSFGIAERVIEELA
jgi:FAD dependent oxidoreductase TIGR03364